MALPPFWRRDRVSLDDGPSWPCIVPPDRWNGWGKPHFDLATAIAVAEYVNGRAAVDPDAWQTRIDRDGDAFVVRDLEAGPEYDDRIEPETIDGQAYYRLGNAWCWWVEGDHA